jgi:hypothetical protein
MREWLKNKNNSLIFIVYFYFFRLNPKIVTNPIKREEKRLEVSGTSTGVKVTFKEIPLLLGIIIAVIA